MPEYLHSPLSRSDSIRLLRLLPSEDSNYVRCDLFEYPLMNSNNPSLPYEALSYVWGSEDKPKTIAVNNQTLHITQNLYTALLRLQDHFCSRVIWVDAICIDQENDKEKENQIPLMAEIYARARHVVVWLGETKNDSDQALDVIRLAGEGSFSKVLNANSAKQAVLRLLQRPWFHRIWVLQEMAAARHVLIMCGSSEIDGHAFCLGLKAFEPATAQVAFLIRGAIFRSRNILRKQGRISLDICSLGELTDMYHAHEATKRHDKVYALLGLCSDDLTAELQPNYNLEWKELMRHLVNFILGNQVSVETWNDKEMAVIKSKGYILGKVFRAEINTNSGGNTQVVKAILYNKPRGREVVVHSIFRTTAKSIQKGDIICLLEGNSTPMIARIQECHLEIIVIAVEFSEHIQPDSEDGEDDGWQKPSRSVSSTHDFLLIWNWETSPANTQDQRKHIDLIRKSNGWPLATQLEDRLRNAIRMWNIAQILEYLGEDERARKRLEDAVESYNTALGKQQSSIPETKNILSLLSWAAWMGHEEVVRQLLIAGEAGLNSKDKSGRTPLSWAAENGNESTVKLLLEAKALVDVKDESDRMPLSWAAGNGHAAVVKLLLNPGKINTELLLEVKDIINSKDKGGRTPLLWAAKNGSDAVVKLLLEAKALVSLKDKSGRMPLSWASENGHEAVTKLLVDRGKAYVNQKDKYYRTPMSRAAERGHKAIVKLLLSTGKADANSYDIYYRTPLSWAANNGHEAIIKLLLNTSKIKVDQKDGDYMTPLSRAAKNGHEAIVALLLDTGKVDADSGNFEHWTPLLWAANNGHEAIVKLLLDTGKVKVDQKDKEGSTPLSRAAKNRHEAVVKLLETFMA